jgi:hypothetical protein
MTFLKHLIKHLGHEEHGVAKLQTKKEIKNILTRRPRRRTKDIFYNL